MEARPSRAFRRLLKSGPGFAHISEEEFEKRSEEIQGYDLGPENLKGQVWDPREHAKYTPSPRKAMPRRPTVTDQWALHQTWLRGTPDWFIVGAGSSLLDLDLRPLDGQVVYGINWTLKWFAPTYLQIIDPGPMRTQVSHNPDFPQTTQLVTSGWLWRRKPQRLEEYAPLRFNIHHPGLPKHQHDLHWAEHPGEKMTWTANSIAYALNVAHWFAPERIILLGFDWGGPHFFGDGAREGCHGHYGQGGNDRPKLMAKLRWLRKQLNKRNQPVVQVDPPVPPGSARRPSKLDVFPKVSSIEEAMAWPTS